MHQVFISSCLLVLAFLLFGHMWQVFRVYVLVHGLELCVRLIGVISFGSILHMV